VHPPPDVQGVKLKVIAPVEVGVKVDVREFASENEPVPLTTDQV
jgi:hypothetical protein